MLDLRNASRSRWAMAAAILCLMGLVPRSSQAKVLQPDTVEAFNRYVRLREASMDQELTGRRTFLWIDGLPQPDRAEACTQLKRGQILVQHYQMSDSDSPISIPGGLIHEWFGMVFIPGVSLPQVIAFLQDYDHTAEYYSPDVLKSKLVEHSGNDFKLSLRLKTVEIVTVVMDTDYDVHYTTHDSTHASSRSYSTRIVEVENAGGPLESLKPAGNDRGFLWRLNNYWRFYQADGGTYVQLDAISLTRDIPTHLGWLIRPFIMKIPSESVVFTLDATRRALQSQSTSASR
jgi:hypothetical protein